MKLVIVSLTSGVLLNACSHLGADARTSTSILSRPDMQLNSAPLTNALENHIYFSKEASSGGMSFGGGGCGCN